MEILLRIKDKCKELYADYDIIIRPVLKFGLAVLIFLIINNELGYLSALNNLFVLMILAVICAILPLNGMVLIGTLLIVAHCFGLGIEVGAFAALLYLLMLLLYFRFVPKDALVILLTPVAFACRVPLAIPLSLGQIRGPVSAFSIAFGIVSWQFIRSVHTVIEPLKNVPDVSMLDLLQAMPNALLSRETIFQIIVFVVVFLAVVSIRRLSIDYSHEKGIVAGAVIYFILELAGGRILDIPVHLGEVLLSAIGSILIAYFLKLFYFNADYAASEQIQFEDDRYYYRVKVMPKLHPVDSRTGETLELDEEEEMPVVAPERFTPLREEELEEKFRGVNLESKLEQSLQALSAKTTQLPSEETVKQLHEKIDSELGRQPRERE